MSEVMSIRSTAKLGSDEIRERLEAARQAEAEIVSRLMIGAARARDGEKVPGVWFAQQKGALKIKAAEIKTLESALGGAIAKERRDRQKELEARLADSAERRAANDAAKRQRFEEGLTYERTFMRQARALLPDGLYQQIVLATNEAVTTEAKKDGAA